MEVGEDGRRKLKPCRTELLNPDVDWETIWKLSTQPGLDSMETSFIWRMLHNILPTPARLHHMKIKGTNTPHCQLCSENIPADLTHCLITCSFNTEVSTWLMKKLQDQVPGLLARQVVLLDLGVLNDQLKLPLVWVIANTLSVVWDSRLAKKKPDLHKTRSFLEAKIAILRKTRYRSSADNLQSIFM